MTHLQGWKKTFAYFSTVAAILCLMGSTVLQGIGNSIADDKKGKKHRETLSFIGTVCIFVAFVLQVTVALMEKNAVKNMAQVEKDKVHKLIVWTAMVSVINIVSIILGAIVLASGPDEDKSMVLASGIMTTISSNASTYLRGVFMDDLGTSIAAAPPAAGGGDKPMNPT